MVGDNSKTTIHRRLRQTIDCDARANGKYSYNEFVFKTMFRSKQVLGYQITQKKNSTMFTRKVN